MSTTRSTLATLFALGLLGAAHAADLPDLRVEYLAWSIGADGARQEISYTERVVRQGDRLWVEREIPAAARDRHERQGHTGMGHKHDDVVGAPLWIERGPGQALSVRLVDRHERRLIEIGEPHYGNVGFGGRWADAYHLLDPAQLSRLQAVGPPRDGVQVYALERGSKSVLVRWDVEGQFAREIRSSDADGLSGKRIRASVAPAQALLPWDAVAGFAARDYSDLLD